MERKVQPGSPLVLTPEARAEFLAAQQAAGASACSLQRYASDLRQLERYVGPAGVSPGSLPAWQRSMRQAGYAPATVCARMLTANKYLQYLGRPDLCAQVPHYEGAADRGLTMAEYDRLLDTARQQGRVCAWLLLQLFGQTGLPLKDLPLVTVEAVRGTVSPRQGPGAGLRPLPPALRQELLRYAAARGIQTGPVFLSRAGNPMNRVATTRELNSIAHAAGLPLEKATPCSLKRLYNAARQRRSGTPPVQAAARTGGAPQTP